MRATLAQGDSLITDWIWWLLFLPLFVTMRRRNGYAAIHDLLSRTRVIVRPRTQPRPAFSAGAQPVAVVQPLFIGPYEVRSSIWKTSDEELLLAFDPALRRNVWIHLRPASAPPLDPARRELSRPARLRWLNGGQIESKRWEAYEAPSGGPFTKAPWKSVRFWLLDLAEELRAALDEPATAPPLALDRIWITSSGRAMLLDFPSAEKSSLDVNAMQSFLGAFGDAALDPTSPLPPDANAFISAIKRPAFDRPEFVLGNLSSLIAKSAAIAPAWRAASLLFLPALLALFGILVACWVNFDRIRWERAWKSAYPDRPPFLHAAQRYIGLAEEAEDAVHSGVKKQVETNDLQLARAYLLVHFSDVITNQVFWSNPDLAASFGEHERKLIQQAIAGPAPESRIMQEAERVVPGWIQKEDRQARRIPIGFFIGTLLFGLVCIGLVEFIASVFFRRSFVLNLFGIAVVDATAQLATRGRLLVRWAVGSLPALLVLIVGTLILLIDGTLAFLAAVTGALGIMTLILVTAAIVYSVRHPSRSIADRAARTHLVPK
jgi:hypothetical protein